MHYFALLQFIVFYCKNTFPEGKNYSANNIENEMKSRYKNNEKAT